MQENNYGCILRRASKLWEGCTAGTTLPGTVHTVPGKKERIPGYRSSVPKLTPIAFAETTA